MDPTIAELQKQTVVAVAQCVHESWERIVVNYEMRDEDGGTTEDRLAFVIAADGSGGFRDIDVSLDATATRLFRDLRAQMQHSEGSAWGTCDLVVDQPGRYRFDFSYEPPKRINGVFDDDSMWRFNRYLETYLAERGQQPG